MKNLLIAVISWFLISVSAFAADRTKPINVRVTAQFGPTQSDPRYSEFASRVVNTILTNTVPQEQLWNKLLTNHVSQLPVSNRVWFAVEVWSEQPFLPSDMVAEITSNPSTGFGKTNTFNNPLLEYNMTSVAEVWQSDGSRTVVNSGLWNSQSVNRFIFLGIGLNTMTTTNEAQLKSNHDFLMGFTNLTITAKWSIRENGVVAASATKILQTRPNLSVSGRLSIVKKSSNLYYVTLPQFAGIGKFQRTSEVDGQWITVAGEYTSGLTLAISSALPRQFFRILVE